MYLFLCRWAFGLVPVTDNAAGTYSGWFGVSTFVHFRGVELVTGHADVQF